MVLSPSLSVSTWTYRFEKADCVIELIQFRDRKLRARICLSYVGLQ